MTAASRATANPKPDPSRAIAFQGAPGAYGDLACREAYPEMESLPCPSFEDAFAAVRESRASLGMIAVENSIAGRVADIHHLLPGSGLHIIGEHFQRVNHHLLAPKGASLKTIRTVHSHVHALSQCRDVIRELKLKAIVHPDTAGAAAEIAERGDPSEAAIASSLAGQIYGLQSLKADIEDAAHNTTRFLVMAREPVDPGAASGPVITSFLFRVRSVPAALYKALGGFATNGVNITKLESYIIDGAFTVAQFYADIEGHPDQRPVRLALEELGFFSREVRILGVYPAHPFRRGGAALDGD
jgi:prephenate dehydratase